MSDDVEKGAFSAHVGPISRRSFLVGSGAAAAAAGAATIITLTPVGAQDATPAASPMAGMSGTPVAGGASPAPGTGQTPLDAAADTAVLFFSIAEATLVDALVSRILPGTADDPGAHEAGVVFYIDRVLSGPNLGYDYKTYTQGPFLVVDETPAPVEVSTSRDIYQYSVVAADQVSRYGFQSPLAPPDVYRRALPAVDAYSQSKLKKNFVDLAAADQDGVLTDMAAGKATGFDDGGGKAFFTQLRNDTIEGAFADPQYGGNRGLAMWKMLGYPGAQAYYAATDFLNTSFSRAPQSLSDMIAKMES